MAKRDYYEVLGVAKGATDAEIKSAYRKLARQHHPDVDKSAGAAERFKEVSEAYQVLSTPEKKSSYDQFGHAAFDRGAGGGAGYGAGGFNPFEGGFRSYTSTGGGSQADFDFQDPFSLFEQFFGSGFADAFRRRPTYQMNLTFEDVLKGTTKEVEVQRTLQNGQRKLERLNIKVPPGVDDGTKMRFGEIDIIFRVPAHPEFHRQGENIFTEVTLTLPQVVLGDVIEVKTVEEKVKLKIPAGTEPDALIRIKGKGLPSLRGGKGDHYVRIKIEVPKRLTAKEKKLYEELKGLQSKKSWF